MATFHRGTVAEVSSVTPRMRRVTLSGLADFPGGGPGAHFKLVLPSPDGSPVVLPYRGPDGLVWPDGPRPLLRTYTARQVDAAAGTLTVDFALHDERGPATAWAAAAQPGDDIVVSGARGGYLIGAGEGPGADWTLLVADETALPAAGAIVEAAPAGAQILLIAEVAGPGEELSFATAADLTTTWLYRDPAGAPAGALAAAAVADAELPAGRGAYWVGLESAAMRLVRRHLIADRGADREQLSTRAYWKRGVANHPDHDTGDDE
jgi:NADPH-dependent ferric siderophore reductase